MSPRRVVLVPGAPVLLPAHASLHDPVPELRAAVIDAVAWALDGARSVLLLSDDVTDADRARGVREPAGLRVGRALLAAYGGAGAGGSSGFGGEVLERVLPCPDPWPDADAVVALASGTARRRDGSPGPVDERAIPFDDAVGAALRSTDTAALAGLDEGLARELWVSGCATLRALGGLLGGAGPAEVDLDDDPHGVQYWVMRWTCAS